jgi:hypothetical protein
VDVCILERLEGFDNNNLMAEKTRPLHVAFVIAKGKRSGEDDVYTLPTYCVGADYWN